MAQPVKFYMDEHMPCAVTRALRLHGADVLTVPQAGLLGAADDVHLERARIEGRVLATQDDDFLRLHAAGAQHAGIAYAPQGVSIGYLIRGLLLIYQVLNADDMRNVVEYL